jgi:PPOX class probable FMN-dependent enzyme
MTELTSLEAVRAHYGEPSEIASKKEIRVLDRHARRFIELSPFLVIASSDPERRADATPRGDAPGFVQVVDETTLLIPDRRGNNRVDTMSNIAQNPQVGLLFFVPGVNETLRVNGRARIVTDEALLAPLAAQGKTPAAGLLVQVDAVYFHCGKALIRSSLWKPETQIERSAFPSLGRIVADQIAGLDETTAEARIEESYRTRLY